MPTNIAHEDFAAAIKRVVERYGSVAKAASVAGIDRGWLSKAQKGREKPPSVERLDEIIARWGLPETEARKLKMAALWEKANEAGLELVRMLGGDGRTAGTGRARARTGRTRLCVFSKPSDVSDRLYKEYVPIEGSYSHSGGMLPPPDLMEDGEREYLSWGPVPKNSIGIRLDEKTEGYEAGSILVFGPKCPLPPAGMGLVTIKGTPSDVVGRFEANKRDAIFLSEEGNTRIPRSALTSYRPFVAAV